MNAALTGSRLDLAHNALQVLANDPNARDLAMARFSDRPPSYTSRPPSTATQSESDRDCSEEVFRFRVAEAFEYKLEQERSASSSYEQWTTQVDYEEQLIHKEAQQHPGKYVGLGYNSVATERVKKRWTEQGIWRKHWREIPDGPWRHEEPLETEPPPGEIAPSRFSFRLEPPTRPPIPGNSSGDTQQTDEQLEKRTRQRKRDRDASRPFGQFNYQVSRESERLEAKLASVVLANLDINTVAYQNVKQLWIRWDIWDDEWGILPGASWKHERPLIFPPAGTSQDRQQRPCHRLEADTTGVNYDPPNLRNSYTPHSEVESPRPIYVWRAVDHPPSSTRPDPQGFQKIQSLENDDAEDQVGSASSPTRGRPGVERQREPTRAPKTRRPISRANSDAGLASNHVMSQAEVELMEVEANQASPGLPKRRSKRLQEKTKDIGASPYTEASRSGRRNGQRSAGLSKPQGVSKTERSTRAKSKRRGKTAIK